MKTLFKALLALLIVGGVAVVTCPDKQAHKDAILTVVNENINDELSSKDNGNNVVSNLLGGLAAIGSHVSGRYLDNNLTVENHFIFSKGVLKNGKKSEVVSIGVFGHVFTGGKENVRKRVSGK